MTRVGWCPAARTVAEMLAMYPGTTAVRVFVGAGKPLPAWDGPVLGPIPPDVLIHVSFKTWDLPAVERWLMAMPEDHAPIILTYAHEPEQGTAAGDPTVEQFRTRWAELVAALADHPRRPDVLLVPVYTRYWWQAHPGDVRWLVPMVDAIGWDIYNDGGTYRTPGDLLSIPRDIAQRTGLPYLIAELGAVREAFDKDGSGRAQWMRDMVAAARGDGAWTVCWFHKNQCDLAPALTAEVADPVTERQTWQTIIEKEARVGRWTDIAKWVGPTANQGGPMRRHDGVVIHIAEGSYDGTIAWQKNPTADVSSHFIVAKDGRIAQMVDTNTTAWTQRDGNGEWLSIENEGRLPTALTDAQVEANAQILAKAHQVYGVPLVVTETPAKRGLGHHSMGAENGYNWGHPSCPGAAIKAQKAAIVARAKQIINGEDDDMQLTDTVKVINDDKVKHSGSTLTVEGILAQTNYYAILTRNLVLAHRAETGAMRAAIDGLTAALAKVTSGGSIDTAGILAGIDQRLATVRADLRDAVADLGEGGAEQVRGPQG